MKKNRKITRLAGLILVGAVVLSACSKSYYDINTDPNNPTNASIDLVMGSALKTTAAPQVTTYAVFSEWMNYWAPSGSYAINSSDGSSYKQTTDFADNNGLWTNVYDNLGDYEYIEKTATASNQYFYIAVAKTMKAFHFHQLVDNFNNVPYSEALKGTTALKPKYDNGKDIYEDLSTQLGIAVAFFQRPDATGSASPDIMFGANNANWAKFANTLRLRLLIRQTEMPGRSAYIQTEINKIVANGAGFLTVDAAVNPGYTASAGKQNPFYGFSYSIAGTYTQDFWRANKFIIAFSQAHNDPRYTRWYAPITDGSYVGNVVGSTSNPTGSLSSKFGPGVLKSVSQPAVIFSAAESYFLQSEAILRGFLAGSALTMFNNGVQASFTYLGAGNAAAYTSQPDKETNYAAATTFNEKLNAIMRQKYLALQDITPLEAYNDYRRLFYLGLPFTASQPLSVNPQRDGDAIPTRILYPTIEYQTNLENVAAQGTINHHGSKVFWMP